MTRSTFLLVGALAAAVTACGESKPAPAADSTAASSTASATDTVKVQGIWSDSVTAESAFTAEYVNGKLVVIEEQMLLADAQTSGGLLFAVAPDAAEALVVGSYQWRVRTQDQACGSWTNWSKRNSLFVD